MFFHKDFFRTYSIYDLHFILILCLFWQKYFTHSFCIYFLSNCVNVDKIGCLHWLTTKEIARQEGVQTGWRSSCLISIVQGRRPPETGRCCIWPWRRPSVPSCRFITGTPPSTRRAPLLTRHLLEYITCFPIRWILS